MILDEYENERNPKIMIQYNVFQKESEYDNEELKVYLTSILWRRLFLSIVEHIVLNLKLHVYYFQ